MKILIKRRKRNFVLLLFILSIFVVLLILQNNYYNNYIKLYKSNHSNNYANEFNKNEILSNDEENDSLPINNESKKDNNDILKKINKLNTSINQNEKEKSNILNDEINTMLKKMIFNEFQRPLSENDFINLKGREEMHTLLWNSMFGNNEVPLETKDFLKYKEKLIKKSSFLTERIQTINDDKKKLLTILHQTLYSWLYGYHYNYLSDIIRSSNGKGIVMSTGDHHFKFARSTIDTLRHVLNCSLPIEIIFNGEKDLSYQNQKILNEFENVYVTDISSYFNNEIIDIHGWAIKPFAILASRFEEIILIDADTVFLRDPEELFTLKGYKEKGTIFLQDRTLYPGSNSELTWLKSWMKEPLPETKTSRFYNNQSEHEMDSSTVVIHKTRNLLGLLAVCKLNEKKILTNVIYKKVHGDKETFWIGFDMARQHYYIDPTPSVYIGEVDKKLNQICGHVGHLIDGKLFFWNGHLIKSKSKNNKSKTRIKDLILFEAYTPDTNGKWIKNLSCLQLNNKLKLKYFNSEEKRTFNEIIEREKTKKFITGD